jgi:hypothetical protein
MGFFKSLGKILHVVDDPVSSALRKQGGTLGTIGNIMNPGGAVNAKIAAGAPVNARTMLDPNGWLIPTPPPPEAPPAPLPPLPGVGPSTLPPALQARQVPYSYPTTNGPLTNLAFQMSGAPGMPGAPPINDQPNPRRDVGLFPMPRRVEAYNLPMLDPLEIARLGMYQNGQ